MSDGILNRSLLHYVLTTPPSPKPPSKVAYFSLMTFETKYSRMDQENFLENSFEKIWSIKKFEVSIKS